MSQKLFVTVVFFVGVICVWNPWFQVRAGPVWLEVWMVWLWVWMLHMYASWDLWRSRLLEKVPGLPQKKKKNPHENTKGP